MRCHNSFLFSVVLGCCLVMALCSQPFASSGQEEAAQLVRQDYSAQTRTSLRLAAGGEDRTKKYHWLFRERAPEESVREVEPATVLEKLDREIKAARKLYLSGKPKMGY
jgi:hypothetical protein